MLVKRCALVLCVAACGVDPVDEPQTLTQCPATSVIVDPPQFQWTFHPAGPGVPEPYFSGILEYGQASFTIGASSLTTRAYRQAGGAFSIPGPTITMKPGFKYVLRYRNFLPFTPVSGQHNTLTDPDVSNLHTHGVHISGESPSDDVTRFFEGNRGGDYVYDIPLDHMGGTYWYHAHHHGSTFLQVSTGGFGEMLIDDTNDSIPPNVAAMTERQLVVAFLDPSAAGSGGDTLVSGTLSPTWTVNGKVTGNLCTVPNEWQHWRVLLADRVATEKTLSVGSSCEVMLLARDGVWRTTAPLALPTRSISLTGASRADLAVRCTNDSSISVNNTLVANILVFGTGNTTVGPFSSGSTGTTWSAARPVYLRDLRGATSVHAEDVHMGARALNGASFDANVPNMTLQANAIQEWTLFGNTNHPFHLHVYQFQATAGCGGAFEPGEYYDTITSSCPVRFDLNAATSRVYEGRTIMHCHILEHEDQGAMGWADVVGGVPPPTFPADSTIFGSYAETYAQGSIAWCTGNAVCSNGNACDGAESCDLATSTCGAGAPLTCNDSNTCTADSCNPATGCAFTPVANGTGCGDGNVCNGAETCQGGSCAAGTPLSCSDNNPCTVDSCDPVLGCRFTAVANGTSCSDGNACNGAETCQAGTCTAGAPLVCNDANTCTTDSCVAATGCRFTAVANGTSCADGNLCNGGETCQAGTCAAGTPLVCNDGNTCTTDSCVPATGCAFAAVANGTGCGDGSVCNGTETCQAGTCSAGAPLTCNDNNACTADTCDAVGGCSSTPINCDDGNACTTDACDAITGCTHTPNGTCSGPATCSFDSASATITVQMSTLAATMTIASGTIKLGTAVCGTVTTTDTIVVNGTGLLTVKGDYGPGKTAEIMGASEIEFQINTDKITFDFDAGDDVVRIVDSGADINNDGDQDITLSGTQTLVTYLGGAGNDTLDATAATKKLTLKGGVGNDHVIGGAGADLLFGDDGIDTLEGRDGVDQMTGGNGNDTMLGGNGNDTFIEGAVASAADVMDGGAGIDKVTYAPRTQPVSITLDDGIANEGEAGEGDRFVSIENLAGGTGADTLVGDAGVNVINGGAGNDQIFGRAGNDTLFGDPGDDIVDGEAGADKLHGNAGNDTLFGDAASVDTFFGEDGDDTIVGNTDGRIETVDCGTGIDTAQANAEDVFKTCENLTP